MIRTRWAAIGAAVTVTLGSSGLALVNAADTPASSYNPITPCRLFDTRSGVDNVGPRNTPLASADTLTVQVTGANGNCTIPATATAIVINTTAVNPTGASYITLYPTDAPQPKASNLNLTTGAPPTPNLVTVKLSTTGAINIYNNNATTDILGDITGYYTPNTHGPSTPGPQGPQGPVGPAGQQGPAVAGTTNGEPCNVNGRPGEVIVGWTGAGYRSFKCFTGYVNTIRTNPIAAGGVAAVALALTPTGNLLVGSSDRKVFEIDSQGATTNPLRTGLGGLSNQIAGLATDVNGGVYMASGNGNFVWVDVWATEIAPAPRAIGIGSPGYVDGPSPAASFSFPADVALAGDGTIFVADRDNHAIRSIRDATVSTLAGNGTAGNIDAPGRAARFNQPSGLAMSPDGTQLLVADTGNHSIRSIDIATGIVTTFATGLTTPRGMAFDTLGRLIVADAGRSQLLAIDGAGVVDVLAGRGDQPVFFFSDGPAASAVLDRPIDVAVAADGTVYFIDSAGLRRID